MLKTVLLMPPFVQPNNPYPSTLNLTAFIKQQGFQITQADLSLTTLLKIFSKQGLKKLFKEVEKIKLKDEDVIRINSLQNEYINKIENIISFLQGKNSNLAYRITQDGFLPKGPLFFRELDEHYAFGKLGIQDKAKYFASMMIDELTIFIQKTVCSEFGLSRYAERISQSPPTFDPILEKVKSPHNYIDKIILECGQNLWQTNKPDVLAFSIPFPGNFLSALLLAKQFKNEIPNGKVIFGGGYVNTELRKIKDKRIFEFTDFITLDDGEMPLLQILRNLENSNKKFVRTFTLNKNSIIFNNNYSGQNVSHDKLPAPNLDGINVNNYFSVTEMLNPMHRLWSDGYWHKITAAHGCYWHRCTFCDTNLDYIKRYNPANAKVIVDNMENLISQSGKTSFHFTDEAAPPSLLKEVAIEIIKRNLVVTWWGNIRFDAAFTKDVCRLLAKSGCIAVSGGIEVADIRVLKLINKGITLEQVVKVCHNFKNSGILIHCYLMYGFPSQTALETINSLENIRQLFQNNLIDSAFWHLFTLTNHSPICENPKKYGVKIISNKNNSFANNDLIHKDNSGIDHQKFSIGLEKAVYNYMHNIGIDWQLSKWFNFKIPSPSIKPNNIKNILKKIELNNIPQNLENSICTNFIPIVKKNKLNSTLIINTPDLEAEWEMSSKTAKWLYNLILKSSIEKNEFISFSEWEKTFPGNTKDKNLFFKGDIWKEIREVGLLFVKLRRKVN